MSNFLLLTICFLLGFLLRISKKLPNDTSFVINNFMIYISLPSLTLLYIHSLKLNIQLVAAISIAWILFLLAFIIFRLIGNKFNWESTTVACLILVAGLGNTSFLGLPMIEVFWGKEGIPVGLLIDQLGSFLILSTFGISIASIYYGKQVDKKMILLRIIKFPPFISIVIAFLLMPFEYPDFVSSALERLGSTLSPLALFSVGFQIRFNKFNDIKFPLFTGLAFKMIIIPMIIFIIFSTFMSNDLIFQVSIFEAAMPPMITAAIIAYEYRLNPDLASMLVGLGIPISFLTLSLWYFILK